jgi:DUF971 family protein
MSDPTTTPVDIAIERERAVTVTFADDTVCEFPVAALRAVCPCASCRGWRERGEVAWPRPGLATTITVSDAELNGAWGLSIRWSDGHDTGIYAWTVLRRWWDDGMVAGLVTEPGDRPDPGTDPR